ncbi:hypothetical protein [Streptomyces katrae]|uniref:Uncharacterized protein n=1 Tax=Streptomyces katrae TaxID=68223 RepID=A0A0F4J958_9ACTN|nr:hypothetical protein [Streptomyces katrae]KJY30720.1 hypothetical protein VR44_19705 [Streptomyces katrae]
MTATPSGNEHETDEQRRERERKEREKDKGGFSRAGRLSDGFSGHWPDLFIKTVENPSAETYTGTVTVTDCTPDEPERPASPASQSVTVAPGDSAEASFSLPSDVPADHPRLICSTLSNGGGVTDEGTDTIDLGGGVSPSPDSSPPEPNPNPDSTPPDTDSSEDVG